MDTVTSDCNPCVLLSRWENPPPTIIPPSPLPPPPPLETHRPTSLAHPAQWQTLRDSALNKVEREGWDCGNSPPPCQAQWNTPVNLARVRGKQEDQDSKASYNCLANDFEDPASESKTFNKPVRISRKDLGSTAIVSHP